MVNVNRVADLDVDLVRVTCGEFVQAAMGRLERATNRLTRRGNICIYSSFLRIDNATIKIMETYQLEVVREEKRISTLVECARLNRARNRRRLRAKHPIRTDSLLPLCPSG